MINGPIDPIEPRSTRASRATGQGAPAARTDAAPRLEAEVARLRRAERELRSVLSHARCILWRGEVIARPGWEKPSAQYPFDWTLEIPDPEAAQRVLPLEVAPGETYVRAWIRSRHLDDAVSADAASAVAFRSGASTYSLEYRCTDRFGQARWLFEDVWTEPAGAGRWHAVGVCTDITDRKRVEEHRVTLEREQAARLEAESANQAKDRFLAILSHELRTPLTPILAIANALEVQTDLPPAVRQDVQTIRRNVELEARLIDDLLDLTRIAKGKLELHLRPADVHASINDAVEICRDELEPSGVRIAVALMAEDHHVNGDPARLQQVVWNLIKNAAKFSPDGGRISIRTSNPVENHVRIQVIDGGIGIAPDVLPRIFNAFEQGERAITRRFGGLGLGLAICRALVDSHGGRIHAHSDGIGHGSTFTVELPTLPAELIRPEPATTSAPLSRRRGARLLLVEDHRDTARLMARLLRDAGHDVTVAGDVRSAVAAAAERTFDLLISDLGLPDGDGTEILRHLRRTQGASAPRAIVLSGFGMEADVQRTRDAGFLAHLTKPVDIEQLCAVIDSTVFG